MKINFKVRENIKLLILGFFLPLVFFYITVRIIPISIFNEESYVSVTASALMILSIVLLIFYVFSFVRYRQSDDLRNQIKIFFSLHTYFYLIAAGVSSGIFWLAQSKTPIPPGALIGDVGNYLQDAIKYQQSGNLVYDYPPGLIFLLGNLSSTLNLSVVEVSKLVYLLFGLVTPVVLVIIYRKILPAYLVGTFLLLTQAGIFYIWKYSALVLTVGLIFLLIKEIINDLTPSGIKPIDSFRKFMVIGGTFGLVQFLYFGYVWWLIPGIIFLTTILILNKNFRPTLLNLFDFYLGFSLTFSGYISDRVGIDLKLFVFGVIAIVIIRILSIYVKSKYLILFFKSIGGFSIVAWSYLIISTNINDTYIYDEALSNPGFSILPNNLFSVLFLFIFFGLFLYISKKYEINYWAFSVIALAISPIFIGLWAASRFQVTGLVELWPRYREVSELILFSFIIIIVLFTIDKFLESGENYSTNNINASLIAIILSSLIVIYGLGNISSEYFQQLPKEGRFSGYSYEACEDQVETKKTSGVFLDKPILGQQVMQACYKLLGEEYIVAPSYQWGFHPIEIFDSDDFWSWSYLQNSSIYFVNQSPESKTVALEFELKKAPCVDDLIVRFVHQGQILDSIVLNGTQAIKISLNLEAEFYEPQFLNLESSKKACTVTGDDRDLLLQVSNLQDAERKFSRLDYFDK